MTAVAVWFRDRMPIARFAPIVAAHAAAAVWAAGHGAAPVPVLIASVGAGLLIAQFRLWDDIEDRDRDRHRHPTRVLPASPVEPFFRTLTALVVVSVTLALTLTSPTAAGALVVLDAAFLAAYRLRSTLPDAVWRYAILLAKYPAFVAVLALALGAESGQRISVACALTFAAAVSYEVLHDRPIATRSPS